MLTYHLCASHIPYEYFLLCPFLLCKFAQHLRKCCTWPFQKGKAISLFILQIITDLLNVHLCFNITRHKYPTSFMNTVLPAGNQTVVGSWDEVSLCFSDHRTCLAQITFFHNTWISSTSSKKFYPAALPVSSGIFASSSVCIACARLLYLQFEFYRVFIKIQTLVRNNPSLKQPLKCSQISWAFFLSFRWWEWQCIIWKLFLFNWSWNICVCVCVSVHVCVLMHVNRYHVSWEKKNIFILIEDHSYYQKEASSETHDL